MDAGELCHGFNWLNETRLSDTRYIFMQSFYDRLFKMEADYQDACKDLESEKGARRHQQELANRREAQLQQLKLSVVGFRIRCLSMISCSVTKTCLGTECIYSGPGGCRRRYVHGKLPT